MIESPFWVEEHISDEEFKMLGQLLLRWSHIENVIGNCLRTLLRLTLEEAVIAVFPLTLDQRMIKIDQLFQIQKLKKESQTNLELLKPCIKAMQALRGSVVHGIVMPDNEHGYTFHAKTKKITRTKKEIFSAIELINYTSRVALEFRYSLGLKGIPADWPPLPDRPPIPEFLQSCFPKQRYPKTALPKRPPRASRAKS